MSDATPALATRPASAAVTALPLGDVPTGAVTTTRGGPPVGACAGLDSSTKAPEIDLPDSDALFREAFDRASIGRVVTLPDGRLARVNQSLCAMLGDSKEEPKAHLKAMTYAAIRGTGFGEYDGAWVRIGGSHD